MQHDLVIEGKVVRGSGVEELQVGVSEGKIAEIRKQGVKGDRSIRAGRSLVFPGFIDIHVHMREPGWEQKEDFRTGSQAAAHGGVTTVVDMPNNPVPTNTREAVVQKAALAKAKAKVDVRFYGGVGEDRIDDAKLLKGSVVGYKLYLAKSTGDIRFPTEGVHGALEELSGTGLPVSLHCEDQKLIDRRTKELAGVVRPDVYCDVRPPEAEVSAINLVLSGLAKGKVGKVNFCHISTADGVDLVSKAGEAGLQATCEAALHHLFFTRKSALTNPLLKTNPPVRGEGDRAATVEGLKSGRISFLVTDHAPHTEEEKSEGAAGVPGLDDYSHVASWLVRKQGLDPLRLAKVASIAPAEFLGLSDKGNIEVGRAADFSILDLNSPELVKEESVRSKCGWSPYVGFEFPGRARWTVKAGEALVDDFEPID